MIITKTPFRISFCGGGSDMADFPFKGVAPFVAKGLCCRVKPVFLHGLVGLHKFCEFRHFLCPLSLVSG